MNGNTEGGFAFHGGEVPYYTAASLDTLGIRHCFTTRHGGVSKGGFSSLNFALGTGTVHDSAENVLANYGIAAKLIGTTADNICRLRQEHTASVLTVREDDLGAGVTHGECRVGDGLVTDMPHAVLSVRYADCVPVLMCDAERRTVCAVHSGWRGTAKGIAARAVEQMLALGSGKRIIAAIGPCIKPCCYRVGGELAESFAGKEHLFVNRNGELYFDLAAAVAETLKAAGVDESDISVCRRCTCHGDDFFSHRRQGENRGTMSAFITLA